MIRSATALAVLLTSTAAHATTGLEWKWEQDQVRRYKIAAQVMLPEPIVFLAQKNKEKRIVEVQVDLDAECKAASPEGKKAWELHCTVSDWAMSAAPVSSDAGDVVPILDEMEHAVTGNYLQVSLTNNGKVRSVSLEGVESERNQRYREIEETLRLILQRTLAGLDLEMPKNGDDKDRAWGLRTSLAMNLPSLHGTVGSVDLSSEVSATDGDVVTIQTVGRATLGSGETVAVNSSEQIANLFEMTMRSVTEFDVAAGHMVSREYLVDGAPTASSISTEAGGGVTYIQAVKVKLIPEGKPPIRFGENEEMRPGGTRAEDGYQAPGLHQR